MNISERALAYLWISQMERRERFGESEKLILDGFCLSCLQTKDNRIWMDEMHWYCYYRSVGLVWNLQIFCAEEIDQSLKHGVFWILWILTPVSCQMNVSVLIVFKKLIFNASFSSMSVSSRSIYIHF